MNNLLCLPLFVLIFIFDPVINSKDKHIRISLTRTTHTWSQARKKCSLIGNEHSDITVPTFDSDLMWTADSARYLPWVEYLGCYGLKPERELIVNRTNVETGTQLEECLLHCKQYNFIGLQQTNCVCLHSFKVTGYYLEKPCIAEGNTAKCLRDPTAFCGPRTLTNIENSFSIYKKVVVNERLDEGNCLAVDRQKDSLCYVARNCSTEYFQICLNGNEHHQNMKNRTWIDSFNSCPPFYMLSRYSLVYNANFTRMGTYWLSNTRRWIQDTFTNPEFCIAATVKDDGHLDRFPIRCDRKLPGLCVSRAVTPTQVSFSDDQAPINKVLLISVIAATSLTILVIVIVVLCVRRNYLKSNSHPTLFVHNEVVYENESNTLSRNQTTNDTIDHMHYQSLNQNWNPIESNYDILHNAEVDITSDREPPRVLDDTAEQRQIEADYQEMDDVSI